MLDYALSKDLQSLSELKHLRLKAMRLFEEGLTNGDQATLVEFIERQLIQDPPRLHLLRDIADDLQQRLLSLREHHFDVRERVVSALNEGYGIDISSLAPPNRLETYHLLKQADIAAYIRHHGDDLPDDELAILGKMIAASLEMAEQLYNDIQTTSYLHNLVLDWLEGMRAVTARRQWPSSGKTEGRSEQSTQH